MNTADLYDRYSLGGGVVVMESIFRDYGGKSKFHGNVQTLKVYDDNSLVRQVLERNGRGKVLLIDGAGSNHCALLGDNIARLALQNGWEGIVVYGCIRDSHVVCTMPLGIKALNTNPTRSVKKGMGLENVVVKVGGITITPGNWLYADTDGIIVSLQQLTF